MAIERDYTQEGGVWNETGHWWEWRDDQGRPHRVDGPAVIHADGDQSWWLHGQRHRADGPAMIYATGYQSWYVRNRDITGEVEEWMQAHDITWPFTPEQRMEFQLRWG